jgi:hypothetical protein
MPNVVLRSDDLHWIDRTSDNPTDQCVHGEVELTVDGTLFVVPEGGDWNLTAAGVFLLRTVTDNNTSSETASESNFLIPCCGFNPWLEGTDRYPLLIQGCNRGVNVFIEHLDHGVMLSSDDGKSVLVSESEWRKAVLGFVSEIDDWYARNPPRAEPDDEFDARGWKALWSEWRSRSAAARSADGSP